MRNVMVATDGSDGANRAIDIAVELAKALSGTLSIVTVGRALSADEQKQFGQIEGDMEEPAVTLAQRILYEAEQRARQAGIASPKVNLVWGDPAKTIIETIQREKPDAIVVGRRGHGQLSGLMLGSISQKLTSLAPCVVIVAP
jgi:nucleotide-binding universal stress UspA family protein